MKNRVFVLVSLAMILTLGLVLVGCSLTQGRSARITPTPTKTRRPLFTATLTPTALALISATPVSTDTPIPPTNTPVPPAETAPPPADTPVPPTEVPPATEVPPPTATLAPPTATPVPPTNTAAPPANTPKPQATHTPVPPTHTPAPQFDFVIKEIAAFVDGSLTATGFHNIYFTVVDASGQPLDGLVLKDENGQAHFDPVSGEKGPGKAEFEMVWADYRFKVDSDSAGRAYTSEITHQLSVVPDHYHCPDLIAAGITPDEGACKALGSIHFSYNVTFQRTW